MADKILATITSKGQITLPAQHRKAWGLKPGDQIAFDPPGGKSVRIEPRRKRSIFERLDELKLPSLGRPLTQKDIDELDHRGDGREVWRSEAQEGKVIGIDTNVLLRIFETEDDPAQSLRARKAIEDNAPVYLHESCSLSSSGRVATRLNNPARRFIGDFRRSQILTEFVVARPEVFERAVDAYGSQKSDFADWLVGLANLDQGLEYTLTFDRGAARRRAFGMVDP